MDIKNWFQLTVCMCVLHISLIHKVGNFRHKLYKKLRLQNYIFTY